MRIRALVQNQVMLILVDSCSSHSFINTSFVQRLQVTPVQTKAMQVEVVNRAQLVTNSVLPNFEWWAQGYTFHSDMKVIDMGAYDAILGYDWLKATPKRMVQRSFK